MKKNAILGVLLTATTAAVFAGDHAVSGYVTKSGTYVAPHMQTNPDTTIYNNYSTRGNTNPYTGQPGAVNPYAIQPAPIYAAPPQPVAPVQPYAYQPVRPIQPRTTQNGF